MGFDLNVVFRYMVKINFIILFRRFAMDVAMFQWS